MSQLLNYPVTSQASGTPRLFTMTDSDSTLSQVTTANYMFPQQQKGHVFEEIDFIFVSYSDGSDLFLFSIDDENVITLTPISASVLPGVEGRLAHYNASGGLTGDPASVTNLGNLVLGGVGTPGELQVNQTVADKGSLILRATANGANFNTVLTNDLMGQNSTISCPDPGAASAKILLDTGAANIITDYQEFVGIENILLQSPGTWNTVRSGLADYVNVKAQAAETSITGIDVTPQIRLAAGKGFRLASMDVIYGISTLALVAHSATLNIVAYTNNAVIAKTNVPLTGTLATATQTDLYVTNLTMTPAFLNTALAKYVFELTVQSAATSTYAFYGLNLHFSKTIS